MRRSNPNRTAHLLLLALALVACQSVLPPSPPAQAPEVEFDQEAELEALDLPVNEARRVRFLPPLARSVPSGDFADDLELEIRSFNVDPVTGVASGSALGSTLSTAKRTIISSKQQVYATIWPALITTRDDRASEHIRLEIRLPGASDTPVCNKASEYCLGYLDIFAFQGLWLGRQNLPEGFVPVPARLGILPVSFKVLATETPVADGPPPATIDKLTGLSGERFDEQAGNCASSFLNRPGQGLQAVGAGLQAVGAVGGLFQGATTGFTGVLLNTGRVADELKTVLRTNKSNKNAVLLIVDDFSNGIELPGGLFGGSPDLSSLTGEISHGALVLHQLLELASIMLGDSLPGSGKGPEGQPYYYFTDDFSNRLYLQVVDVGEYDTDQIPDRIRTAMQYYGTPGSKPDTGSMVVNMSFAIVPCSVLHDFEAATDLTDFEAYLEALAAHNNVAEQYLAQLDKLVSVPVGIDNDPLLAYFACPLPSEGSTNCDGATDGEPAMLDNLFQVASSGNYGNGYALYPAASPFVISVGSHAASSSGYGVASYSNAAEIAAPGGLYQLSSADGQTVAYAGTSFAAPVVSLYLAVDSMKKLSRCRHVDVRHPPVAVPQLASGVYDLQPFYTLDEYHGDDALSEFCENPV